MIYDPYNVDKWDLRFIGLARFISVWSKDPSTKTGAVIVAPNRRIVSTGFNGFPQNMPDDEELYLDREEKYSRIVHCEMNAVLFAMQDLHNCTLYTYPFLSCDNCFKHMLQVGITRFVAPRPNEDQLSRWGDKLEKTKQYALEAGVIVLEVNYE